MFVFVVRTIYIKIENVSILLCNSRYFLIYSSYFMLPLRIVFLSASRAGRIFIYQNIRIFFKDRAHIPVSYSNIYHISICPVYHNAIK